MYNEVFGSIEEQYTDLLSYVSHKKKSSPVSKMSSFVVLYYLLPTSEVYHYTSRNVNCYKNRCIKVLKTHKDKIFIMDTLRNISST